MNFTSATVVRPLHLHHTRPVLFCRSATCCIKQTRVQAVKRGEETKEEEPWWRFWRRNRAKQNTSDKKRILQKRTPQKAKKISTIRTPRKGISTRSSGRGSSYEVRQIVCESLWQHLLGICPINPAGVMALLHKWYFLSGLVYPCLRVYRYRSTVLADCCLLAQWMHWAAPSSGPLAMRSKEAHQQHS